MRERCPGRHSEGHLAWTDGRARLSQALARRLGQVRRQVLRLPAWMAPHRTYWLSVQFLRMPVVPGSRRLRLRIDHCVQVVEDVVLEVLVGHACAIGAGALRARVTGRNATVACLRLLCCRLDD